MNGYEAFERLEQLNKYIQLLGVVHSEKSTWNEEFGEGNPDAKLINNMLNDFKEERNSLITVMENTTIE